MIETGGQADAMGDGGRWLTYAELADARGITRKAAVRMTQRHRWRRTPGNDGAVRVYVPDAMTARAKDHDARLDGPHGVEATDVMPFHARALAALEAALQTLREGHTAEVAGLREAIASRDVELSTVRDRLTEAEAARDQARAEVAEAAQTLDQIRRADEARRGKGRLRRAWDGWRGR
jgi:hypothetical protein